MAVCLSACQYAHRCASTGAEGAAAPRRTVGPLYRQNPYSALSFRSSGSPGFASPPGPPREPAGTSRPAEALPHGLVHASGLLPRAIDTWPPEMNPVRSISSCSTQFHASAGWVLHPVPWTTKANEQSWKVRLPNSQTADRLLPLEWESKTILSTGRGLSTASPFLLFTRAGWLAGWLRPMSIVARLSRMTPLTSEPAAQLP